MSVVRLAKEIARLLMRRWDYVMDCRIALRPVLFIVKEVISKELQVTSLWKLL